MADVTLHIGKVEETYIVPVGRHGETLYTAVFLHGEDSNLFLSTAQPRVIERGRMVVSSLTAALDALEEAIAKKSDALEAPASAPVDPTASTGGGSTGEPGVPGGAEDFESEDEQARRRVG